MLPPPQNTVERQRQEDFYREQVNAAFRIIDVDGRGFLDKREVSYLMRYLLQFPSEAQVRDYIIVKLEDDEPSQFVKQEKVEAFMVNVLMTNEFEPAPAEHLLAAFRIMDPDGTGKIRYDVLKELLTTRVFRFVTPRFSPLRNSLLTKQASLWSTKTTWPSWLKKTNGICRDS